MSLQYTYDSMVAELEEFDLKNKLPLPTLVSTWRKNWIKRMEELKTKIETNQKNNLLSIVE